MQHPDIFRELCDRRGLEPEALELELAAGAAIHDIVAAARGPLGPGEDDHRIERTYNGLRSADRALEQPPQNRGRRYDDR